MFTLNKALRFVRNWPKAARRVLIAILASVLAVGMVAAQAPTAHAAVPEARTTIASGSASPDSFFALGSTIVSGWYGLAAEGGSTWKGWYRSTDSGATWAADATLDSALLPTRSSGWSSYANGTLVGIANPAVDSTTYSAVTYSVASDTAHTYPLPAYPSGGLSSSWALSGDGATRQAYNFVTQQSITVSPPSGVTYFSGPFAQLSPTGAVVWSGLTTDYHKVFAVASSPGATPAAWVTIDDFLDYWYSQVVTTSTELRYLATDASGVSFCRRSLSDLAAAPSCLMMWSGLDEGSSEQLYNAGSSTIIRMKRSIPGDTEDTFRNYLWNGTALIQMQNDYLDMPAGANSEYGDTAYIWTLDANGAPVGQRLNSDGSLGAAVTRPQISTNPQLALALDRVAGADDREGTKSFGDLPAWTRTVSGSGFGVESALPRRASWIAATAARTAVSGPDGLSIYDRGTLLHTFAAADLAQISGPYVSPTTADSAIVKVDGTPVASVNGFGTLFGSHYITLGDGTTSAGTLAAVVHDLTGATADRPLSLPTVGTVCYGYAAWNNLLGMTCYDTAGTSRVMIFNASTGALVTTVEGDWLEALGDGYFIDGSPEGIYTVVSLSTSTSTTLSDCTHAPVTDGVGHVLCSTDTQLVWRDFSSLSTAAPRLLGVLAAGTVDFTSTSAWTPQIDTTKALAAGTLVIRNSTGTTVRTLTTPASNDGSIRGVTWNGRNDSGAPVATGTYTYTLTATGKDGSGATTAIDGTAAASGTVTVTANVADTTAYEPFVKAAYQDFLNRQPTATELSTKSTALSNGTLTKNAFLTTMANSDEWLSTIVTKMYQDTLGRAPDAAGLTYWTGLIRNRTFSVAEVASRLYSSDEYYLYHAGATPTTWVTALYHALLSRAPDTAGLQQWVAYTNSPSFGRNRVAFEFYQSTESRLKRVDALYQALLGRGPDPTGWPYWAGQVYTTGDIVLATNLANSEEYWLRAKARYTT